MLVVHKPLVVRQYLLKVTNFRGIKISRFGVSDLKIAKLKCHKIQFLDQNAKLKCREKKPIKTPVRKQGFKNVFLCFA